MELTFLGTGSAMPTGERYQAGYLLEQSRAGDADGEPGGDGADDPDGTTLLVDCGSGALQRLARTDAGYEGVDAVLLSHHHLDHVADLLPLLKARWLAGADELPVVGPPGTADLLADLLDVHDYLREKVAYDAREVEPGAFSVAGFDVDAVETRHSAYCLAYRFGDALAVSGDSEAFDDLAAFADGVDAFVHDCSFPDEVDVSNHPTPAQLGEALAGHEYGTVYLSHLYPHTDGKHGEMLDSIGERYDGEVRFARDGRTVTVGE